MFGVRWNNWGWEVVVGFLSFFFLVGGGCFEKGGWIPASITLTCMFTGICRSLPWPTLHAANCRGND